MHPAWNRAVRSPRPRGVLTVALVCDVVDRLPVQPIPIWSILRGSFSVYKGIGPGHLHVSAVPTPKHTLTSHCMYLLWGVLHSAVPYVCVLGAWHTAWRVLRRRDAHYCTRVFRYRSLNGVVLRRLDIVVAVMFSVTSLALGFSLLTMMSQLALEVR